MATVLTEVLIRHGERADALAERIIRLCAWLLGARLEWLVTFPVGKYVMNKRRIPKRGKAKGGFGGMAQGREYRNPADNSLCFWFSFFGA
jgi:hypothetical protein